MGIATAIGISLAIGAATNIAKTVVETKAAKKSAETQAEAAKKVEQRSSAIYDPYLSAGGGAATTLADMMGIQPGVRPGGVSLPGGIPPGGVAGPGIPAAPTQNRGHQPTPQPIGGQPLPLPTPQPIGGHSIGDAMVRDELAARTQSGYASMGRETN